MFSSERKARDGVLWMVHLFSFILICWEGVLCWAGDGWLKKGKNSAGWTWPEDRHSQQHGRLMNVRLFHTRAPLEQQIDLAAVNARARGRGSVVTLYNTRPVRRPATHSGPHAMCIITQHCYRIVLCYNSCWAVIGACIEPACLFHYKLQIDRSLVRI